MSAQPAFRDLVIRFVETNKELHEANDDLSAAAEVMQRAEARYGAAVRAERESLKAMRDASSNPDLFDDYLSGGVS
ncbi:hypothetical protein AWH62_00855 [Maricaulis sp. W15]|uniref:hypothetical protein n=1 Tax=Maricaulis sp. W15 TaxID=1772333 RepID=UPI000948E455|nr:hypothetical protein [Maricaulis sp. W15]OLF81256.1 hypothetical protein AWH62_00855 [Maricaulis sp. W15]